MSKTETDARALNELHQAIMNLPCKYPGGPGAWAYDQGHRDARHAAAELALQTVAVDVESLAAKIVDELWARLHGGPETYGLARERVAATLREALRRPAPAPARAADLGIIFDNNSDCYADTSDDSVVMAMSKERFIDVASRLPKEGWQLAPTDVSRHCPECERLAAEVERLRKPAAEPAASEAGEIVVDGREAEIVEHYTVRAKGDREYGLDGGGWDRCGSRSFDTREEAIAFARKAAGGGR